jgi:hypothetical protein
MFTANRVAVSLTFAFVVFLVGIKVKDHYDRVRRDRERIGLLREQYPLESLEARLPPPPQFTGASSLSQAAEEHLSKLENSIDIENSRFHAGNEREAMLRKLHQGTVEEFVEREGFGVERMFGGYASSVLALGYQKDDGTWVGRSSAPIRQPSVFTLSTKEADLTSSSTGDSSHFLDLHLRNLVHFLRPRGFGAMQDRRHVAGFQPHQFNEVIEEKSWKLTRVELVGLLSAEQPRVYVTENLPRMQDMKNAPTRSPDAFETAGLEKLRRGEDLFIRDMLHGVRLLGAIRSAKQCIECHGGERGALLGAFSYGLRPEP